ncbi:MAG: AAA family ATPase [Cyanobacteriota bacterium]
MTKLLLLIGLPGSGKSTLASRLCVEYPGSQLISTDIIRAQLFGSQEVQGPWPLVWREVEQQFKQAVAHSSVAIYDATNAVRRYRKEAIALARVTGFTHIIGLWWDTPLCVCLERNKKRDRYVPEEVILQMHSSLFNAPPILKEGFDYLIRSSCARCGNCDPMDEKEPNSRNLTALIL